MIAKRMRREMCLHFNFTRLKQYIKRILYAGKGGLHGEQSEKKTKIITELYNYVIFFLNEIGAVYWLDYGTLLGYFRENGIIKHDNDIDLALLEDQYQLILQNKNCLDKHVTFMDKSKCNGAPKIKLNYKGFDCDLYFYKKTDNFIQSLEDSVWQNETQRIDSNIIIPLKTEEFLGHRIYVPNETKKYLETIYGYLGPNANRNKKTGFWEKLIQ